jgi:hypothetical protein
VATEKLTAWLQCQIIVVPNITAQAPQSKFQTSSNPHLRRRGGLPSAPATAMPGSCCGWICRRCKAGGGAEEGVQGDEWRDAQDGQRQVRPRAIIPAVEACPGCANGNGVLCSINENPFFPSCWWSFFYKVKLSLCGVLLGLFTCMEFVMLARNVILVTDFSFLLYASSETCF